jgi:type III secretion protein Q
MSVAVLPLRRVDAARLALEAAFRRCLALGLPVSWVSLPRQGSLLRFRQSGAEAEVTSLIPTAAWVARHWPSLPGLAWDALDDDSARILFGQPDRGPIDAPWLRDGQAEWLHHIRDPEPVELPCVDTDTGPVWIESLLADAAPDAPVALRQDMQLWVDYRLGQCELRVAQLRALQPGDVVLLANPAPMALLEGQALFSFALNEEHIMVIDFDAMAPFDVVAARQETSPTETDGSSEPRLRLGQLSVTVDVVLCRIPQSLASLSELQPGSTIALADAAHRNVELRVQGQLLATGELVGVGDGLGVQIQSRVDRK